MNFNHDTGLIDSILTVDTTVSPPLGGDVNTLRIIGTGSLVLPIGTNAQRPGTPEAAMVRFNTDSGLVEFHNGTTWTALSTSSGTVSSVAVTGSTGLSVGGSPITSSGTITLTLGTELQGLSGLSTTGLVARTAAGTYAPRTVTGTAGNVTVTNGDGVAGNPTIDLATAGTAVTGQFVKITTDAYGRVTATSSVAAGDITTLVDGTYVNVAGDSMSSGANLTFVGGGEVLGLPASPSGATAAVSKAYVDALVQGVDPKPSVRVATTVAGTLATSFEDGDVVDGVTLATGNRILIKNQAAPEENGIYLVNASGAPTRAPDFDSWTEVPGAFTFVEEGTANADTGWVSSADAGGTLGTTAITWSQFSGAGTYTAGTGLTLTGSVFSLTSPVTTATGGTGLTSLGTANQVLGVNTAGTGLEYKTITAGTGISITPAAGSITIGNTGVTSVALSAPSIFSVSGSPVTTTGTLALSLATQTANTVFAGPSSGGAATPTFRALAYSDLPLQLYAESASTPTAPSATGTNSVAIGSGATASAVGSAAVGAGTNAAVWGGKAFANGSFATAGDAQAGLYVMRNITANATPTELFLDGVAATQRLVLPNNSVVTFRVVIAARRTDATGGGAGYEFIGVIRKDGSAASTTFVGSPAKTVIGETNFAWNAALAADTTNGSLTVTVTGEAAKTVRWVATVMTTEVTN